MSSSSSFDRDRHMAYFSMCLRQLPEPYSKLDTNRLTLVHFAVHALDLLGLWDEPQDVQRAYGIDKNHIIEWIYSLQTTTSTDDGDENDNDTISGAVGFLGGNFLGSDLSSRHYHYNHGHIAMTYTALATLTALGDDLSRVDRRGIALSMPSLQLSNGSFQCIAVGSEHDLRFLYAAACVCHMLSDWSGLDRDRAVDYVRSCRSWDGAIALLPGQEGHGGSTFCGVATLVLLNRMDVLEENDWKKELIQWCVQRQVNGMQGRPNKDEDTCYSYWIGATLKLLGKDDLLDHHALKDFVLTCQTKLGGFGKVIGAFPDVLHSFYSMAYLSMSQHHLLQEENETRLKELNCTLGFCNERAACFEPIVP